MKKPLVILLLAAVALAIAACDPSTTGIIQIDCDAYSVFDPPLSKFVCRVFSLL